MNYSENDTVSQKGIEINILNIIRILLKRWWLIAFLGIAVSAISLLLTQIMNVPTYSSSITFIVSNRGENDTAINSISSSDISSSIKMTNNFIYLLEGRTMCKKVAGDVAGISVAQAEEAITARSITDTSIIEIMVETEDKALSKKIADAIVANYKDIVKVYSGASIDIYYYPELAEKPNPNKSLVRNGVIGLFLGLSAGVIIAAVQHSLKNTVQSAEDIREKLELNIMGTVTQVERGKRRKKEPPKNLLISEKASGFGFIETYKAIRTKVESAAAKNGFKTFIVSSAVEDELAKQRSRRTSLLPSLKTTNRSCSSTPTSANPPSANCWVFPA